MKGRKPPRAHGTAPDGLKLRDIRDLTLHGGVDANGRLVLLPLFSGLGIKGIQDSDYSRQSRDFWADGHLERILRPVGWKPGVPAVYQVRCPALTEAMPLPSAAVIDHVLECGDAEERQTAVTQLSRCTASPKWRVFHMLGEEIADGRTGANALLAAEARLPGLLSERFRQVLESLQTLHCSIDVAEGNGRFLVLDGQELNSALTLARQLRALAMPQRNTSNWSTFYRELQDSNRMARVAMGSSRDRFVSADPRNLLEQLKATDSMAWGVLADVGAKAMMEFASATASAEGQGAIAQEGTWMAGDLASDGFTYENAIRIARPRSLKIAAALGLAWQQLVERAMRTGFYAGVDLDLPALSQLWANRFASTSGSATLMDQYASRPIAEGGVVIVRTTPSNADAAIDSSERQSYVRIEPAIVRPHVAATRPGSRPKKFPKISDRLVGLDGTAQHGGEALSDSIPSLHADERSQLVWPHGRVWQAVDLARTLVAAPHLLLCPEVLTRGYLQLPAADWEQLNLSEGPLVPDAKGQSLSWRKVYDWFLGVSPWPTVPIAPKKPTLYSDPTATGWPMTVVDGGLAVADVRLAVRFVPAGSDPAGVHLESLAALVKDLLGADGSRDPKIAASFSSLGERLRFAPRPFFEVEGRVVEEAEWLSAVKTQSGYYRLANGLVVDATAYVAKTDQYILRKRVYARFASVGLGEIWSTQRQALLESATRLPPDEYLRQLALRISPVLEELDRQALAPLAQNLLEGPLTGLGGVLRPYQLEGLAWTYLRLSLGLGVCLADEMGLGKTLQAIAVLRTLRTPDRPSLVVMPKTLLHNWRRELERFGGDLRVGVHGEATGDGIPDVVLVTYPRLRLDQELLTSQDWNMVVLDEAQTIKNSEALVTEAASQLRARHRLALTGTPIENRAAELWSIINWLNPGYLGGQADFSTYTTLARSSEQKAALLAPLRECLQPVILRRLKSDPQIALGLPEKVHLDLCCELSEEQTSLYEAVIETVLAEDDMGLTPFKRSSVFLKAILHLKQICIHPELFYGEHDENELVTEIDAGAAKSAKRVRQLIARRLRQASHESTPDAWLARSGKLRAVRDLIESIRLSSRGILIFTQYLGAADLLRRALAHLHDAAIPFIHGGLSSAERFDLVDEFNDSCRRRGDTEPCPILILSLKAGGTGLNLTGADRVIHFDRWWNPAVEDQATDRAHRIGQNRTVFTHTITSQATIEEAIARLFEQKRQLAEDLLGAAASEDLGELLRDRAGFLDLVDPQRLFSLRLGGTPPSQPKP